METTPSNISSLRQEMGPTHMRSIRKYAQLSHSDLQFPVLGPGKQRGGRTRTNQLEVTQQLHQPTVQPDTQDSTENLSGADSSNDYRPLVAGQAMVSHTTEADNSPTMAAAEATRSNMDGGSEARAAAKPPMAPLHLESQWCDTLSAEGWADSAIAVFCEAWAPKTRALYNCMLKKCNNFCTSHSIPFPPASTKDLADFLMYLTQSSQAPRAQLNTAGAALTSLYNALHMHNFIHEPQIQLLITGAVKAGTSTPAKKSLVMPVAPLRHMLYSLGDNMQMDIDKLRLKALTSLALVCMLRPSDIAPRTNEVDATTGNSTRRIFGASQVRFRDNAVTITFLGIKNDTSRSGFEVTLPASQDKLLDPVHTLQTYLLRTEACRRQIDREPVFITLQEPYHAISADTARHILDNAINLAGLSGHGFSAKCFRPTGATYAVELGYDPELVMRIGRWKTRSVFFDHYVHSQVPSNFTTSLLDHD